MDNSRPSGKDLLENGLRNIQSFLKGRSLPGKARLNRREQAPSSPGRNGSSPPTASGWGRSQTLGPHSTAIDTAASAAASGGGSAVGDGIKRTVSDTGQGSPYSSQAAAPSNLAADSIEPGLRHLELRGQEEASTSGGGSAGGSVQTRSAASHRVRRFHKVLSEPVVDLDALRELAWSGVPPELRPLCWRLLLGYLPPNSGRQAAVLARKRREYQDMVPQLYDISNSERSEYEVNALRQVSVDVPRTAPSVPFFQVPAIAQSLERMLYIWGIRHTASGYVQGMNDLATPFYAVFLSEHLRGSIDTWTAEQVDTLSEGVLLDCEADCYWCLSKLLEGVHDHYTDAQPGIQITVHRMKEVARRYTAGAATPVGEALVGHLDEQGVNFLQFAFRWVNCLLVREVPFALGARLWDTYLAEGPNMGGFLKYVCASFLLQWERELRGMEFQDMLLFLQKLPTADWTEAQLEVVLSRAFVLRSSSNIDSGSSKPAS